MRRSLAVALFVLVIALSFAAPAMAQARDPFQPLVEPDGGSVVPGDPAAPPAPAPNDPMTPPEPVPNTGADVSTWAGSAYVLVALGAALLVLGQLYRRPHLRALERAR